MSINNPYTAYQQNSVNTATPGELTLMLYNGCLKFIKLAYEAIEQSNLEEKNLNLQKVQKIVTELMISLNMDIELSKNMIVMYEYINHRLVEANTKNDLTILKEVENFVIEFRDTWKDVIHATRILQHGIGGQA